MVFKSNLYVIALGLVVLGGCNRPPSAPTFGAGSSQYSGSGDATASNADSNNTPDASGDGSDAASSTMQTSSDGNSSMNSQQDAAAQAAAEKAAADKAAADKAAADAAAAAAEAAKPITPCSSIDWNKLSKPEDIRCLGSKEKVFSSIPDFVKPYWSFVKSSRSAQSSSLDKPRVLVFSPELTFIIGGATDDSARNDLEIAVFNYDTEAWDFAGIDFSTNPPKMERDLCKTCHSKEARPIWERYGGWPNVVSASHDGLTQDEANFLNKARQGQGPAITKSLKYQGSYKAKDVIFPAENAAQNESNEMIGDIQGIQAGRSLAAKLMKDTKLSDDDRKAAMKELVCGNYGEGATIQKMSQLGYPIADYLFHGIAGVDKGGAFPVNPYLGRREERQYVGMFLLYKMMQKDSSLKDKLPEVNSYFTNPLFGIVSRSSVGDRLKARDEAKGNITDWNYHLYEPYLKTTDTNGDVCSKIRSL